MSVWPFRMARCASSNQDVLLFVPWGLWFSPAESVEISPTSPGDSRHVNRLEISEQDFSRECPVAVKSRLHSPFQLGRHLSATVVEFSEKMVCRGVDLGVIEAAAKKRDTILGFRSNRFPGGSVKN